MPALDDPLIARARRRLGQVLRGKYRLEAVLGVGGMATVYRATHRNLAEFAIKMLHPELSLREDIRQRFLREGYAANSVKHPGAARIVDDDVTEDGAAFLVMELLDGVTVEELTACSGGRLPLRAAASIVLQLLGVLEAAHAHNVVHRDIKPANLFVTVEGELKVLDFGIARALEAIAGDGQRTGDGVTLGTPAFMAPEQALGRPGEVDARTDLWAAGATLFAAASGRPVHGGASANEVLVHAATARAPSLADALPGAPAALVSVVDRALAFDRDGRWLGAASMREALTAACREAFGEVPGRDALAPLVAEARASRPPDVPVALAPTEDLSGALAPTIASSPALPRAASQARRDDTTKPVSTGRPPARARRRGLALPLGAAVALAGIAGAAWIWKEARSAPPRVAPFAVATQAAPTLEGPTALLILGVANTTVDPVLDGTLDLVLGEALLRSSSIEPVWAGRLQSLATELGGAGRAMDEELAARLAARDHRRVVTLKGSVAPAGAGYALSVEVREPGRALRLARREASSFAGVVPATGRLAWDVREALGESRPIDPALEELTSMSASLEADHELLVGRGASDSGSYATGEAHLQRALLIDPEFSLVHGSLATAFWNEGRRADALKEFERVFALPRDSLSQWERLRYDADFASITGEEDHAIELLKEMLSRRPHSLTPEVLLAAAYMARGDAVHALELGRLAATDHPTNVQVRSNLGLYLGAAGDLEGAAREGQGVLRDFPHPPPAAYQFTAIALALLGRRTEAAALLDAMSKLDPVAGALALADVAASEDRLGDAEAAVDGALARDDAGGRGLPTEAPIFKAELRLRAGDRAGALGALAGMDDRLEVPDRYRVALLEAAAGGADRARARIAPLRAQASAQARVFAHLFDAERLLDDKKLPEARAAFTGALGVRDAWLAHYGLGRVLLAEGDHAAALRELEACHRDLGLGLHAYGNDVTLRVVTPVDYYRARAQEGVGEAEAADTYRAFLARVPGGATDPLVVDARRRIARLEQAGATGK